MPIKNSLTNLLNKRPSQANPQVALKLLAQELAKLKEE